MAREMHCDVCKKPTPEIAGKLHYIPTMNGAKRRSHSDYTHHCDVGVCCADKFLQAVKFQKRIKRTPKVAA